MPSRKPGFSRRLPIGAEIVKGGVHFRVWAPKRKRVEVVFETGSERADGRSFPLHDEGNGYFSGLIAEAEEGTLYRYRLDHREQLFADPASRFQPNGPFGASMVVNPNFFSWTVKKRTGIRLVGQVVYEMHIGTLTREGTWEAASRELTELNDAGITLLQVMPVADFPGRFGWGYDGVSLFAPTRLYGRPDDFRSFIDQAHVLGMGVILDVVYNHLGPSGNFLREFSDDYFTDRYPAEWGEPLNYDGENSGPVREFVLSNAQYWISEYRLDGLRLDATQSIFDSSGEHIVKSIARVVRQAARGRSTVIIAENEPQDVSLIRAESKGGAGLDGMFNDDFHHSAMVALTGRNEAYYTDYLAAPQEFVSMAKYGFLYQGQLYKWQGKRRGTPTFGVRRTAFIHFLQNHDQIANSGQGLRCHHLTGPGKYKALTALLLLGPETPLLFQGQEFAASTPFFYFVDFQEGLALSVQEGRINFLGQFRSLSLPEVSARLPDPTDPAAFVRCKLDTVERQLHAPMYNLHRDLLRLRQQDPVFSRAWEIAIDGAVLGPEAFLLRFFDPEGSDRLLIVNLGRDLHLDPAPEPLLAPPKGKMWEILWSSEDPRYQGNGTAPLDSEENWLIPGNAAVVLSPGKGEKENDQA